MYSGAYHPTPMAPAMAAAPSAPAPGAPQAAVVAAAAVGGPAAAPAPAPSIAMMSEGGVDALDDEELGRRLRGVMQQPGAMVRNPVPHSRVPLAPLPIWDGADPNYTAEDVLRNVEFRARYFDPSLQGLQQLLASVVGPVWQRQVCAIEQECLLSGRPLTWEYLKVEFLRRTGHVAAHTAHTALTQLLDPVNGVKQTADQSVSQYLVTFQIKLREAGQPLPEPVLVELFIRGLLPLIRVRCLTDHMGRPHSTLSAAHDYAHGVELHMAANKPTHKRAVELPIAGWHGLQRRQHRGRGGGGGGHRSSGSSSAGGSSGKGVKPRFYHKHPQRSAKQHSRSPLRERAHGGNRSEHGGGSTYLQDRSRERGGGSNYGRGGGRAGGSNRGSYHQGPHGGRGSSYHGHNTSYAAFAEQQQPQEREPAPAPAAPLLRCPGCGTTTASHAVFCPLIAHRV
jgi:hypothetical protein